MAEIDNSNTVNGWLCLRLFEGIHSAVSLTASEQAIYFAIWRKCNAEKWSKNIIIKFSELEIMASVTTNTLRKALSRLQTFKLIDFSRGKHKGHAASFSLLEYKGVDDSPHTMDKGVNDSPLNNSKGVNDCVNNSPLYSAKGVNDSPPLYTYNKTKTISMCADAPLSTGPDLFSSSLGTAKEERKKSCAQKKKEETTAHWRELIAEWEQFYQEQFRHRPTFNGEAGKHLKSIADRLRIGATKAGNDWNSQVAVDTLRHFLTKATKDKWLRQNFLLRNLSSQYDKIIVATASESGNAQRLERLMSLTGDHEMEKYFSSK